MKLNELFDYQKDQLRETYICNHVDNPSYGELSDIESVTDEMLEEEFGGVEFTEEDFW